MKVILFVFACSFSFSIYAKEWKSMLQYQKATQNLTLPASDWLRSDRCKNTLVWQNTNVYNLIHNNFLEYQNIKERRDFYDWIDYEFKIKGHEVIWQRMAYYISGKLKILESFPHKMFMSKRVNAYVQLGSEVIFNEAFQHLKSLFLYDGVFKGEDAFEWDQKMLHDEQFIWVEKIYKTIDPKSQKKIENMAKGKFIYALVVPKAIRFYGDISDPKERYFYAMNIFRPYCKYHLK